MTFLHVLEIHDARCITTMIAIAAHTVQGCHPVEYLIAMGGGGVWAICGLSGRCTLNQKGA